VHIAELSTVVVQVAIKVITASLTQNKCLQCVTPPLTHVGYRDRATPLNGEPNNDGMSPATSTTKVQPNLSIFSKRDLINDDSSFCSHILLAIDLQCHLFTLEKLLLHVRLCL